MIEMLLFPILGAVMLVIVALGFLGLLLFKGIFRLLLLPFSLAAGALKLLVLAVVGVFLLALLPLGLVAAVLFLPALFVIAIVGLTRALAAA